MSGITIMTPDPILEKLLLMLTAEFTEDAVLLDAAWMERMAEFPEKKVILFTDSAEPAYLSAARQAGAEGFWYVTSSAGALAQVLTGKRPFPEKAPEVQLGNAVSGTLTARELDVLRELVTGKTDAQIGDSLSLAVSTVKHHVQQLFFKTGFSNRTQLAVAAVSCGLIRR